jgi:hypothetical protein
MLHTATIGLVVNPKSPELSESHSQELQVAAHRLGLQLYVLNASTVPTAPIDLSTAQHNAAPKGPTSLFPPTDGHSIAFERCVVRGAALS